MNRFGAPKAAVVFGALFLCLGTAAFAEDEVIVEEDGVVKNVKVPKKWERIAGAQGEKLLNREFSIEELYKYLERFKRALFKQDKPLAPEEKEILKQAEGILKRNPAPSEDAAPVDDVHAMKSVEGLQSANHEKLISALERYLARFTERRDDEVPAILKPILPYIESLRQYIDNYLKKLDHTRAVIDIGRAASGLPTEKEPKSRDDD